MNMSLIYDISKLMVVGFGKMCGPGDQARLAAKEFPTDLVEDNDLQYIEDGTWEHRLDVYYPEGTSPKAKLPVLIDIHGGGWGYGDKELNKLYCLHCARRGYVVFNISYRLAPQYHTKDQMQDCMAAMKYVSKHLKDYPCDAKRIYITGDSAGGQLAAHCAGANLSKNMRKAYDLENPNLKIKGVCLTSAVPYMNKKGIMSVFLPSVKGKDAKGSAYEKYFDFNKILKDVDEYPPTILFTSLADVIASGQTKKTYKMLKKKGVPAKLINRKKPSLMHVYPVLDPDLKDGAKAIDDMTAFFNKNK